MELNSPSLKPISTNTDRKSLSLNFVEQTETTLLSPILRIQTGGREQNVPLPNMEQNRNILYIAVNSSGNQYRTNHDGNKRKIYASADSHGRQ